MRYDSTGRPYFIDHNTRTSQWFPPFLAQQSQTPSVYQHQQPPIYQSPQPVPYQPIVQPTFPIVSPIDPTYSNSTSTQQMPSEPQISSPNLQQPVISTFQQPVASNPQPILTQPTSQYVNDGRRDGPLTFSLNGTKIQIDFPDPLMRFV